MATQCVHAKPYAGVVRVSGPPIRAYHDRMPSKSNPDHAHVGFRVLCISTELQSQSQHHWSDLSHACLIIFSAHPLILRKMAFVISICMQASALGKFACID